MSLSLGIVGLPNVGKSTLFNALTKKSVAAENFPFCTIDPSVGVVAVPDIRLSKLSTFSNSLKTIPTALEFVDIAGLVAGAAEGEGLGNKFLANIRETDAIAHVVRIFEDQNVHHVDGTIDPLRDIETIQTELILADMETVSKRLISIERDVKRGDKEAFQEKALLKRMQEVLESEKLAHTIEIEDEEKSFFKSLHLLTAKPMLYLLNKKAGSHNLDEGDDERFTKLISYFTEHSAHYVVIDAGIEDELKDFEGEEKNIFRDELGSVGDGIDELIKEGYKLLNLQTFFTTGEDETRGWTIAVGATAPEAGAAIHSDFEDNFIKAEVIQWNTLLEAGSYGIAREKGLLKTEGKEYIVKDGDVIEFKI